MTEPMEVATALSWPVRWGGGIRVAISMCQFCVQKIEIFRKKMSYYPGPYKKKTKKKKNKKP